MRKKFFSEIITTLFVILFLYTGICKLIDYAVFKEQIATSSLLDSIAPEIAASVPCLEFTVVFLLLIPRWRLKGFYLSLVMMTCFTIYIIAIILFNKNLPCSCGGVIELLSWNQHIVLNAAFIILAAIGIAIELQIKKENKSILKKIMNYG